MKKSLLIYAAFTALLYSCQPKIESIINVEEVGRIEKTLSADDMEGRQIFTPGLEKAADFIASEFKSNDLPYLKGEDSYFQNFTMIKTMPEQISGSIESEDLSPGNVIVNTTKAELNLDSFTGYELVSIEQDDQFNQSVFPLLREEKNLIVLIDPSHLDNYDRLKRSSSRAKFPSEVSQIFIFTPNLDPQSIQLEVKNELMEEELKNVVAMIPGKSKPDEYVVFGGHYDHIGIRSAGANQDSIYNGANDNAAGTTAVLMLAKYFNQLKDNERTLIFVAFTAEESGGFGSTYFSKQLNPDQVVAMFNIEMIGTDSKWGTNSAYITGFEKSSMGEILQKNLSGSKFQFEPDPYPMQNLFYRSDNRTLAALGVPAHTISTAKMEEPPNDEPNYHKASDEFETLDMVNMTEIIKAIAISSQSIISGEDTPTRVEKLD
ncbi:M28 family peptidase [Algoriphagus machipongonensis]|uniref:Aminopeptidase n=1 Tax=Algoriphagus machipongonensis TaxID=388413 RepID=A3HRM1_9BACT|nr:M28 family peptidase [Algoriphagus machipongonensis]EAZ82489.1 aminopeptidase [Algoriphagus machipongonensis]